jgi:hypothetical protein
MSHHLDTALLRLARYLLARLLPTSQRNAMLGDLDEEYVSTQLPRLGRRRANWWYAREAILALAFAATQAISSFLRGQVRNRRDIVIQEHPERTIATSVVMNVFAFVAFWLISFALIQFAERLLNGWPASGLMQVAALAVGVIIALRMRARVTAFFLAGFLAFACAEFTLHSIFGIRTVQGGPTHFAVMAAGILGVGLGVFLAPYVGRRPSKPTAAGLEPDEAAPLTVIASDAVLTA